MWLRQSTASQEILLGRFVDSTDGNTEKTALTIANTDIKLWAEGATTLASKNSGGATHIANGLYYCVLDATDTATLGKLEVHVHVTGALAVKREFMVLPANVYDSLVLGTDALQVDAIQLNGTAQTARDIGASVLISSGTGTGQLSVTSGVIASNVTQFGGSAGTFSGGRPEVNASHWGGTAVASANVRANLTQILGTAPTEGAAGRLAGAFTTLFDVASPVLTAASVNQTGDSYARIGATGSGLTSLAPASTALSTAQWTNTRAGYLDNLSGGAVALASGVTVSGWTSAGLQGLILTNTGLVGGDAVTGSVVACVAGAMLILPTPYTGADAPDGSVVKETAKLAWDDTANPTRTLTANPGLDAAGVRSAVGLASANLDTQLDALPTAAAIADQVWDEALSGHLTAGTTGAALNGASAPTAATVAAAVWDLSTTGHTTSGTFGAAMSAAGSAGDPWETTLPGAYGAGTAGYIVGTNLDATVSSRSTYAGADTSGTTTLLSRLSATRAGYLDNLSGGAVALASGVTVSGWTSAGLQGLILTNTGLVGGDAVTGSVVACVAGAMLILPTPYTGADAPDGSVVKETAKLAWDDTANPTRTLTANPGLDAAGVRSAVGLASANLDTQLDTLPTAAEVVTALGTGSTLTALATAASITTLTGYVDTEVAAIKAKTDNLPASPAAVGSAMTLAAGSITEATISTPAESAGRPTGILGMMRRVFEGLHNKRTRDRSTGVLTIRNAADTGNLETATQSTTGTTDTQTAGG